MFAQAILAWPFCHNSHIFSKESLAFSTCHLALDEAYQVEEKRLLKRVDCPVNN